MEEQFNKPERGNKSGVYLIQNAEGEDVQMVAESFPQADALVRMGAKYVKSVEEWRAEQLNKKAEAVTSDKKGK